MGDYNAGLWTSELDSYIDAFDDDAQKYVALSWQDGSTDYYSIIVHVPNSQVVLELIGDDTSYGDIFTPTEEVRYTFVNGAPSTPKGYMTPLKVSRAVSDIDEIVDFYSDMFGIERSAYIQDDTYSDGTQVISFQLTAQATVQIMFVYRDPSTQQVQGEFPTDWFQDYLVNVTESYMGTSYKSCWPIWGDNHYCLDSQSTNVNAIVQKYDNEGLQYHLFKSGGMGPGNGYFVDPTGWSIQLDGQITIPNDAESFSPQYCYTSCL